MSLLSEKLAPLWSAINRLQARQMSIFPATVTNTVPLRIRIDGESQSLAASPSTLVPTSTGDRVRVLRYGTTHLIIGSMGRRIAQEDIFSDLAPGVSFSHGLAHVRGSDVIMRFSVSGLERSSGSQNEYIGTLTPALHPAVAVPLPGYFSNGDVKAAITGSGTVSLRYSSASGSGQLFFSTAYPKG